MNSYIPKEDFEKNYLYVKRIKDNIVSGLVYDFRDGHFLELLLIDSNIFTDTYFNNKVRKGESDNGFRDLVSGGLRKKNNQESYNRAKSTVRDELIKINVRSQGLLRMYFSFNIKDRILPLVKESILEEIVREGDDNKNIKQASDEEKSKAQERYDLQIEKLWYALEEIVTPQNTYYKELYNEICEILNSQSNLEDLLSLLLLISIFQDDIYLLYPKYCSRWSEEGFFPFHPEIKLPTDNVEDEVQNDHIPLDTIDFFSKALSNDSELGKISNIDMAFHGGSLWLYDGKKHALLLKAIENGVKVRILINTSAQVKNVCSHMRQPGLRYTGFEKNANEWNAFMETHSDLVEVRIAQIPLLRRTYIIMNDNGKGWANITYYSYGNYDISKDQRLCFGSNYDAYKLYLEEFNYIWTNASTPYTGTDVNINDQIPSNTAAMVKKALSNDAPLGKVVSIDMASHSGLLWLTDTKYVENFLEAINRGVKFRIIVNTESIDESAKHMRQPIKKYPGFNQCLMDWLEREKQYPDLIEVRVAEIPIFHCIHIIKGEKNIGWARVRYYTYGNYDTSRDKRLCFSSADDAYQLYLDEFEYIWEISVKGTEYATKINYSIINKGNSFSDDSTNISYFSGLLRNKECNEINMISVLAYYCANGTVSKLIKDRLSDDSGFVLKMVLPNPQNVDNLERWYIGFEEAVLNSFKIFESWVEKFPNRFLLHYTDLPISDRMYINRTGKEMLVEHLSIPQDTNLSLQNIYSTSLCPDIYIAFERQFDEIWKEYSSEPLHSEYN